MVARTGTGTLVGSVVLAADSLTVVHADARAPWQRVLEPCTGETWPTLRDALRAWRAECGAPSAILRVAVHPALAEVRVVQLPPVSDDDARRLLVRAASRYFLEAREEVVVGVAASRPAADGSGPPARLAACMPLRTLRAIHAAATEADCEIEVITPVVGALAATAAPAVRALQICTDQWTDVVTVERGMPTAMRRFRTHGDDAVLQATVRAFGSATQVVRDVGRETALALNNAATRDRPSLWPLQFIEPTRAAAKTQAVPREALLMVGAAALVAAATLIMEWQTTQALAQVRADRAALAGALNASAPARRYREQAQALQQLDVPDSTSPSHRLADVTEALPDNAYLTRVLLRGDTLTLEGRAPRVGQVWDALRQARSVGTIVASAPVRRDAVIGGTALDRFEFTVRPPGAP